MSENMVVIITGGSSGLGKALAQRFIKKGATVVLIARNKQKLAAAKDELLESCKDSSKVAVFNCDVADFSAIEKTFKDIIDSIGKIDILINSAGILREGYFEKLPIEVFREIMDINYFGTLNCSQAVIPFLKSRVEAESLISLPWAVDSVVSDMPLIVLQNLRLSVFQTLCVAN